MIKHFSFDHGWWYHYKLHSVNSRILNNNFLTLKNYLENIHEICPNDYFKSGPRTSQLKFNLNIEKIKIKGHEICQLAQKAIEQNGRSHTNIQTFFLNNDKKTIASEVPIWLETDELRELKYLTDKDKPLTGHIDILRKENGKIWILDYKPNAEKEKYAITQLYFYTIMLSKRTKIPIEDFRCGYFDEKVAYIFKPENGRL